MSEGLDSRTAGLYHVMLMPGLKGWTVGLYYPQEQTQTCQKVMVAFSVFQAITGLLPFGVFFF